MKQKLLNSIRLRALLLVATLLVGGANFNLVWGDEEVYKTALFGSSYNSGNQSYTSTFEATNETFVVTVSNFNNSNNGWTNPSGLGQIKCGRKSSTSVAAITTKSAIDKAITKVVVTIDAITVAKVNSIKLYTSSNGSQWTLNNNFTKATGAQAGNVVTPTANQYYKVEFDCASGSSNGLITVSKVEYYVNAAPTYALTIDEPVGGTITVLDESANEVSSGDKFQENAELTISAEAFDGYTFSTWTKTAGTFGSTATTADNTFTMPAEAATIGATFTKNSYNLSLSNTNGSCAVTVDGDDWDGSSKIPYNSEVVITATPDVGYLFESWTSTSIGEYDELTNPLEFTMPAGDVEVEATFADASSNYSITVDDDIVGGTISADKNTAAENATITLTATPSTGYTFTAWTVLDEDDNAMTVSDNKFSMPASNVTVTATFTPIAVTGVSLNKTSTSISVGETETLTATVVPANALNKGVTWTSSDTSVATVSDGVVTAVAAGSTTITVTTIDGSFAATCTVTVVNAVTFDAASDKGNTTGNNSADEMTKSGVTINSTDAAFNQTEYRLYSKSTTTISVSGGKITTIEFTKNGSYDLSKLSADTGTYNSSTGVWTGVATSVVFSASAQVRLDKIKVYYMTTATPTFSVAEGEYSEAKSVELSCATDGATIYYTTDGSTPTNSSTAYSSAISVTETMTLKAIAIMNGVESEVASATYTMICPASPTFDVAEGFFDKAFDLHLSTETDGATIYYSTDGSDPTSSSAVYDAGISIPASTTIVKAIAVKSGLTSDVASATYTYDSRPAPTFTLSETSLNLKVNVTSDAVSLTTNSDGVVTFSCDDSHVTLTGTGASRTISADSEGSYTVNVTVAATSNYLAAAGTITVAVTKKGTTMVLTPSFTSKDIYVAKTGSLTGTPTYNESSIDGAEVTYTSSDTKVATIADNGTVTFKKAGSTTIKASYEGDDEYEACEAEYILELVDTTPQETEVSISLNNTFFDCEAFSSYAKESPTSYEASRNHITVTYDKGTGSGFYCNATGLRLYTGGSLTFAAPEGYVITKIVLSGQDGFYEGLTNPEASTTWTGNESTVSITGETKKEGTRKNMTDATVTLAETVTVGSAGYTTYVTKHDVAFPAGVTGYIATAINTSTVHLDEKASVPAATPIVVKAAAGTYALPAITTTPESVTGNLLQASDGSVAGDGSTIYALSNLIPEGETEPVVGFYQVDNGIVIPAGKAYLVDGAGVKGFTFDFDDDDATTIEKTLSDSPLKGENIYNLAGQRLGNSQLKRGIYIVNGKKVLK